MHRLLSFSAIFTISNSGPCKLNPCLNPLDVVVRGSETHLQVSENYNLIGVGADRVNILVLHLPLDIWKIIVT